jgi:hypothetical protein
MPLKISDWNSGRVFTEGTSSWTTWTFQQTFSYYHWMRKMWTLGLIELSIIWFSLLRRFMIF